MSLTGAVDLQVSNGSLGINGREAAERQSLAQGSFDKPGARPRSSNRRCTYGKLPRRQIGISRADHINTATSMYLPTFEVASVKLFNVVDFPLDGCAPPWLAGSRFGDGTTNLAD
jgi:hypothetical protein